MPLVRQSPRKKTAARITPYVSIRADESYEQAVERTKKECREIAKAAISQDSGRDAAILKWAADVGEFVLESLLGRSGPSDCRVSFFFSLALSVDGQDQESDDDGSTAIGDDTSAADLLAQSSSSSKAKLADSSSSSLSPFNTPPRSLGRTFPQSHSQHSQPFDASLQLKHVQQLL